MKEFIVEKDCGLKEFTDETYAQGSFYFRLLLKNKDIRVNGVKTGENIRLHQGDVVAYYLPKEKEEKPAFFKVYEDERVLVVDKESGVNAEAVYSALKGEGARFIHRLDRNTQGLMIFAKSDEAEKDLLSAFKTGGVEKVYHARLVGTPSQPHAILTAYLQKDAERSLVKIYDTPCRGAERIVTEYEVLSQEDGYTMVAITLHTGKTHQIRAHMAHIGCPVLGDEKYGDTKANAKEGVTRQRLVAKRLKIHLPYLIEKTFVSRFEV